MKGKDRKSSLLLNINELLNSGLIYTVVKIINYVGSFERLLDHMDA